MTLDQFEKKYRSRLSDLPDEAAWPVLKHCYQAHELDVIGKAMLLAPIGTHTQVFGGDLEIICDEVDGGENGWECWVTIRWKGRKVFRCECNDLPKLYLPNNEWHRALIQAHADHIAAEQLRIAENKRQEEQAKQALIRQRLLNDYGIRL